MRQHLPPSAHLSCGDLNDYSHTSVLAVSLKACVKSSCKEHIVESVILRSTRRELRLPSFLADFSQGRACLAVAAQGSAVHKLRGEAVQFVWSSRIVLCLLTEVVMPHPLGA